jgi:adenylate cyclase
MSRFRDLVRRPPRSGIRLPDWLDRLTSIGIVTKDPDVVRRQRFTNVASFAAAADAASHFIINGAYAWRDLWVIHAYNGIMTILFLSIHRLHRFGDNVAAITLILMVLAGNLFAVWVLGLDSSLQVYFTLAGAMLFVLGVENWRLFLFFFVLYCAALFGSLEFAPVRGLVLPDDTHLRHILSAQAMINTIVINAALLFYALAALRRAERDLEEQYARSEALVANVMPPSIAARLKSGIESRIADRIDNLSVLFADLVGFTTAAHELPPGPVVDYLDGLVCIFDLLCEQHGVEKIKTIGDSYMAVAGLDGDDSAGAIAVGQLALAMMNVIAQHPPLGRSRLAMRIGIHCGEATAGVIGETRFSYDVWGDTVNLASRMESYGEPGRIQVSEAFRSLTQASFVFEDRGATPIKDLGEARTAFLIARR